MEAASNDGPRIEVDVDQLLADVEAKLITIDQQLQSGFPDIDGLLVDTERVLNNIAYVCDFLPSAEESDTLLQQVSDIYKCLEERKRIEDGVNPVRGRPSIEVSEEQLSLLLSFKFKTADIACMLQVSPSTIRRRIDLYGLTDVNEYSEINYQHLETIVHDFAIHYPHSGQKSFEGYLLQMGLRVQRRRIRSALQTVDPNGVRKRLKRALHRRQYKVPMPNSLWHIDGHHKLIRWRIIIHGGIDRFSRLPVYLKASANNRADTVFNCFMSAVASYGLPSRVRSDKGGENVKVSEYMHVKSSKSRTWTRKFYYRQKRT